MDPDIDIRALMYLSGKHRDAAMIETAEFSAQSSPEPSPRRAAPVPPLLG